MVYSFPILFDYFIIWLDMSDDGLDVREFFLDLGFDFMGDEMTYSDGKFSIHKEMNLDDPIESTFSYREMIHIFYLCMTHSSCAYGLLHLRIIHLIEEFTESRKSDMPDVIEHKKTCHERCPIGRMYETRSSKESKESSNESNPCRDGIREMMPSITDHGRTLEAFSDDYTSNEEESFETYYKN